MGIVFIVTVIGFENVASTVASPIWCSQSLSLGSWLGAARRQWLLPWQERQQRQGPRERLPTGELPSCHGVVAAPC